MSYKHEELDRLEDNGYVIRILVDPEPMRPDEYNDDDSIFLVGFHRDFYISTKEIKKPEDIKGWSKTHHVLALNAYIHSGVMLSISAFSDKWDSGQLGYVLVKRLACWKTRKKAEFAARSLVDTWNKYLNGGFCGFIIEDKSGNHIDSCWGFDDQLDCLHEAKNAIESAVKRDRECYNACAF